MKALFMVLCGTLAVITWSATRPLARPAPAPVPVRVVAFEACGDSAGILVVRSDGSSEWFRPPYLGLAEAVVGVPDDEKMAVQHCPAERVL